MGNRADPGLNGAGAGIIGDEQQPQFAQEGIGNAMLQEMVLELVKAGVRPEARPAESGILVAGGVTQPFVVERGWSGVAGYYTEQWSIRRGGRQTFYSSKPRQVFVRGLQSVTSYTDTVSESVRLEPGEYNLVFLVDGLFLGYVDFSASAPEPA